MCQLQLKKKTNKIILYKTKFSDNLQKVKRKPLTKKKQKKNMKLKNKGIKIKNQDGSTAWFVQLDKKMCEELLKSMPDYQRDVRAKNLQKIERAITNNNWRFNGQTIVIDSKGRLIDGQHRIKMFIQKGFYPEVLMSQVNVDTTETLDTYNTLGDLCPRSMSDSFKSAKIKNYAMASSVAHMSLSMVNGQNPKTGGCDVNSCIDFYREHEEDLVNAMSVSKKLDDLVNKTVTATCAFFMIYNGGGKYVVNFINKMASMMDLSQNQSNYAKLLLANIKRTRGKMTPEDHFKTFLYFLRCEMLGFKGTSSGVSQVLSSRSTVYMGKSLIKAIESKNLEV